MSENDDHKDFYATVTVHVWPDDGLTFTRMKAPATSIFVRGGTDMGPGIAFKDDATALTFARKLVEFVVGTPEQASAVMARAEADEAEDVREQAEREDGEDAGLTRQTGYVVGEGATEEDARKAAREQHCREEAQVIRAALALAEGKTA
jgi:hypothetical protein